tara:strand:+ start:942 stop:1487 length:546 start_codon:yes stop_codon:yes gene_type:complete
MKDYTGLKPNMLKAIKFVKRENNITFWLFKCDCGKEKIMNTNKVFVKNTTTKSCGCLFKSNQSPIIKYNNKKASSVENYGLNRLITWYKHSANVRNYIFNIDVVQFKILTKGNCHYCNSEPSNIILTKNHKYIYNGIDRINNELGYELNNCVSCCTICNRAKNNLKYDVFINWINNIKYNI